MDTRTTLRGAAWVAWGAILLLAPGAARTMGEGGSLPLGYYLWTSAIPLAFVAAALAWALRDRLGRWPEWALRYVAWVLWGIVLVVWVLPADAPKPASPIESHPGAEALTEREREVVEALVTGSTQVQVAEALAISLSTVATYRARACEKLGVAALVVPWLVLLGYARLRDMRVRPRRLTAGVSVVLLALVAAGMLVGGGWYGLEVRLGSDTLSVNAFAPIAYAAALAALAPHLLWSKTRETLRLDEERCVLYLRGRGAGELQAHVLLKIALGLSTPEVCEALHVAPGTVNAYRAQGYELLGVHTSRQLADLLARDVGCVPSAGKIRPSADDSDTSV